MLIPLLLIINVIHGHNIIMAMILVHNLKFMKCKIIYQENVSNIPLKRRRVIKLGKTLAKWQKVLGNVRQFASTFACKSQECQWQDWYIYHWIPTLVTGRQEGPYHKGTNSSTPPQVSLSVWCCPSSAKYLFVVQ